MFLDKVPNASQETYHRPDAGRDSMLGLNISGSTANHLPVHRVGELVNKLAVGAVFPGRQHFDRMIRLAANAASPTTDFLGFLAF